MRNSVILYINSIQIELKHESESVWTPKMKLIKMNTRWNKKMNEESMDKILYWMEMQSTQDMMQWIKTISDKSGHWPDSQVPLIH